MDAVAMTGRRIFASRGRTGDVSDDGVTLIELVVSMAIMSIFLVMFTGAMLSIYHTTNKTQSLMDSSAQIHVAFDRLDTSIRYASAVSAAGTDGSGNPSIAFETTYTGTPTCTQLRLNRTNSQLQQRTWATTGSAPAAWLPLASNVGALQQGGSTVPPFTVIQPTSQAGQAAAPQQLRIRLASVSGSGQSASTAQTDVTFVAFNSAAGPGASTACAAVISP